MADIKIQVEFNTDNASFHELDINQYGDEAQHILNKAMQNVRDDLILSVTGEGHLSTSYRLIDSYGNHIGNMQTKIMEDK